MATLWAILSDSTNNSANWMVQLDWDSKLPAVDWSNLTDLPAAWSESTQTEVTAWENLTAWDAVVFDGADYVLSDASDSALIDFKWFADTTVSSWNPVNLNTSWVASWFSGLSAGDYYLSDAGIQETIESSFSSPQTAMWGLTFDWTNLISCGYSPATIYIHDWVTNTISSSFASPSSYPSWLTIANGNLISCDTSTIYIHSWITSTISSSFSSPSN